MKNARLALAALFALAVYSYGQANALSDDVSLEQLETAWNEAHLAGDLDALKSLWADDIVIFIPSMPPLSRADAVLMWEKVPVAFTQYDSTDIKIRHMKDSAVVTGRIDRTRDFGGRSAQEHWYFTKAYEQRDGSWRVVVFHASPTEN